MKHSCLLAILLLVGNEQFVFGQQPRITIGNMVVELGMEQAAVVELAATRRHWLFPAPSSDNVAIVWSEAEFTTDRGTALGTLVFEDGVLTQVFKSWTLGTEASTAEDLGDALFAVAAEFVQNGQTNCTLETRENRRPDQEVRSVNLRCGRRTISLSTARNSEFGVVGANVNEHIR